MNMKKTDKPLTFEEWKEFSNVESRYEQHHDEYGDSCPFYSQYAEYHYNEYLERWKRAPEMWHVDIWG